MKKTSMTARKAVAVAATAITVIAPMSVNATDGTWTGAAGDGLWTNTANWTDGVIPAGGGAASFPLETVTTVQLPAGDVTIGTLSGTTNFTLRTQSGGMFILSDARAFGGTFALNGGKLSIVGTGGTTLSNLYALAPGEVNVQESAATVVVASACVTNGLTKTGAGALTLMFDSIPNRRDAKITLADGSLAFADASMPTSVTNDAWFHADASLTNRMTFYQHNGTNFIRHINDVRTDSRYAYQYDWNVSAASAPRTPWLAPDFQNGLSVADFGSPAGEAMKTNDVSIGNAGGWGGTLVWNERCTTTRSVLVVFADREECKALSYTGPYIIGDTTTYHFGRGVEPKIFSGAAGSALLNGSISLDGYPATMNTDIAPIGDFHLLSVITAGNVTAGTFSQDRTFHYGGQRLAEAIICTNALPQKDFAKAQLSLAEKWIPFAVSSKALTLSGGTLIIPEDETLVVTNLTVTADTTVSGGGTLRILSVKEVTGKLIGANIRVDGSTVLPADLLSGAADLDVGSGTCRVTGDPQGTWFHVDASQTNTMTFAAHNGTNFITRVADINNNGRYASQSDNYTATSAPHAPWLAGNLQNGLSVIDFGTPAGEAMKTNNVSIGDAGGWGGALVWSERCTNTRSVFVVFADREECQALSYTGPYIIGDTATYQFSRGYEPKIFSSFADSALLNGSIFLDGHPATMNTDIAPIGDFHMLSLIATGNVNTCTFSQDRNNHYGGQRLAEAIICTNAQSLANVTNITDYFNAKWFGKAVTNAVAYTFGNLTVAEGATLDIGLSPMNVGVSTAVSLSGGGTVKTRARAVEALSPGGDETLGTLTVDGSLSLASGATWTVDVSGTNADCAVVSGALAFNGSGTVTVNLLSSAYPKAPCLWPVAAAGSVDGVSHLAEWTVTGELAGRYSLSLTVIGNTVYMTASSCGTLIKVR